MNTQTIENLRKTGFKVRVLHRNLSNEDLQKVNLERIAMDSNPNVTEIHVTDVKQCKTSIGIAYRAKGDRYNRKIGNAVALGRALKYLK
jgi:hypothetical protein